MMISICIPTYNRAEHLCNCLQSIISNISKAKINYEVCVSDNCSTDHTENIVYQARKSLNIKYHKNTKNMGISRNFLNVVNMASGDFVWLIGDDDLLLPNALEELDILIKKYQNIDFFYINSYHLTTEYVSSYPQPFDTANLPQDMTPFSGRTKSGQMSCMDLIDPKISFDFLGGMFLSVFRKEEWCKNVKSLDEVAINDQRTFSHFDNTFPHLKIFANAFSKSKAYFNAKPLSVNLSGVREWSSMSPLVTSVRLVEALREYRINGLPFIRYLRCKNYALSNFIPDIVKMIFYKGETGFEYINLVRLIFSNCLYPNFYLSVLYFGVRKIKNKHNDYF